MKKIIILIIASILLIGGRAYAAGDLVVEGKLGVGTDTLYDARFEVTSTDEQTVRTTTNRSTVDNGLTGYNITLYDSLEGGSKWLTVLSAYGEHAGSGHYTQNFTGGWFQFVLKGSTTNIPAVIGQTNNIAFKTSGDYYISTLAGNTVGFTDFAASSGTYTITNMANYYSTGITAAGTGVWNVENLAAFYASDFYDWNNERTLGGTQTNVAGMIIEKQTLGENRMGIWLKGDGEGADIVLGASRDKRIYSNGGDLIIDLASGGNVGIGTVNTGSYKLAVAGDISVSGCSGCDNIVSDIRLKDNVRSIGASLEKVKRIRGVMFNWREEGIKRGLPGGRHYGIVAQEIEGVLPEVVREGAGGEKIVAYLELIPLLIEAVKEQQEIIEGQRREIEALKESVKQLEVKEYIAKAQGY
jgi:hypothetical protein